MKLFVTGGSGFVGGAVIRALGGGNRILAMARSDAAAETVGGLGAEAVPCSLQDVDSGDMRGVDIIVHCAAFVEAWGPPEAYESANVDGTARLLVAARQAGVKRFVHMSTESVLFTGGHLPDMDETWPYPSRTPFPYAATKGQAERMVLAANGPHLSTVVLRPVLIWGPGDRTILPEVVEMARAGKYVWLDGGRHRVSPTHIDNLVHAVGLALKNGEPGEVYFITDEETPTLRDFLTPYAATAGVVLPARSVPGWLARASGWAIEAAWRRVRRRQQPPITRMAAALLSREITVRSDKARRELGYRPSLSIEEGLRRLRR